MRAAFPYIDDFLAAGTVASLERLGEVLGGARAADVRRGGEAAAHVSPVPPAEQPERVSAPVAIDLPPDPQAAPKIT
jgi:hypothetical protein